MGTSTGSGAHTISVAGGDFSFDPMGFIFQMYSGGGTTLRFGNMTALPGRLSKIDCRWSQVTEVRFTSTAEDTELALYVWGLPADASTDFWSARVGGHKLAGFTESDRSTWVKVAAAMSRYSGGRVVLTLPARIAPPPKKPLWRRARDYLAE
ncbi:hypothetical protein ACFYO1_15865 [Nocardia sp. NPDC006044]|uniref:hypothetical protein n=1 Tax=Nocardia sp. NPDC006044 TaxID=3364306 RepID=UPI0036C6CFC1